MTDYEVISLVDKALKIAIKYGNLECRPQEIMGFSELRKAILDGEVNISSEYEHYEDEYYEDEYEEEY